MLLLCENLLLYGWSLISSGMVRVKHRYFLVEIKFANRRQRKRRLNSEMVYRSLWESVKTSYGDYGVGALRSSCSVKYLNKETNMTIIRVRREFYRMAQVALTFVKKIGDHDCLLHTLHVGGTIRACQKFLIRHHRKHLPLLYQEYQTQEEQEQLQQSLLSACINMENFSSKTENKERSVSQIAGEEG